MVENASSVLMKVTHFIIGFQESKMLVFSMALLRCKVRSNIAAA